MLTIAIRLQKVENSGTLKDLLSDMRIYHQAGSGVTIRRAMHLLRLAVFISLCSICLSAQSETGSKLPTPDYSNDPCGNPLVENQLWVPIKGQIVGIEDGSTVVMLHDRKRLEVHLVAIAVERNGAIADQAKAHLVKTALNKDGEVLVNPDDWVFQKRKPREVTGVVWSGSTDLGLSLLILGLARAEEPRPYKISAYTMCQYRQTERNAKAQNLATNKSEGGLKEVLKRMDLTAAVFRTAQADFVWKNYTSVVNTFSDPQPGKIYFRRFGNQIEMAAELLPPAAKQLVFSGGKMHIYTPRTGEVQEYDASEHREEFETILVVGFGSGGSDLHKSFDVKYCGRETVNGAETDKLELIPTSTSIKARFPKVVLWINSEGVSLRQQLFDQNEDYRLADYSNIKLNKKLPKDAFKLKTSGKVNP